MTRFVTMTVTMVAVGTFAVLGAGCMAPAPPASTGIQSCAPGTACTDPPGPTPTPNPDAALLLVHPTTQTPGVWMCWNAAGQPEDIGVPFCPPGWIGQAP